MWRLAAVSGYSGDTLPPNSTGWPTITYCTFKKTTGKENEREVAAQRHIQVFFSVTKQEIFINKFSRDRRIFVPVSRAEGNTAKTGRTGTALLFNIQNNNALKHYSWITGTLWITRHRSWTWVIISKREGEAERVRERHRGRWRDGLRQKKDGDKESDKVREPLLSRVKKTEIKIERFYLRKDYWIIEIQTLQQRGWILSHRFEWKNRIRSNFKRVEITNTCMQKKSPVNMSHNLSGVSFLTSAAKPDTMTKRQIKEREMLNESRRAEGNRANSAGGEENAPGKKKKSGSEKVKEKKNIIHLVLIQTLTPISPPPSISQPERICVRCASYSAQPFTVTISARGNQLKLKIKSHLILPDQTPLLFFFQRKLTIWKKAQEGWGKG